MNKLVIIPTYNEKENIEKIARKVFSLPGGFHLLVVDDGSPDGTATIVKTLQNEFAGKLHILERSGKLGLGTAYIAGFKWALQKDYEYIFEMDADFSHDPEDLTRLYEACAKGADMAVGSRYTKGGKVVNWPWDRNDFDLVLMDIQMPLMNGEDALREIRRREQDGSRHLPVIALTAYALREEKKRFLELGFDGYASKPLVIDELVSEMKRVVPA